MALFDNFKKILAENNENDSDETNIVTSDETGEQYNSETGDFNIEEATPEYKEFIIQRLQKLKKVILKDVDSATIMVNYIKASNTESDAINNCETLYSILKDIKVKLQDQGVDLDSTNIIDLIDNLCEYIMLPESKDSKNLVVNPEFRVNPEVNVQSLLDSSEIVKGTDSKQINKLNIKELLNDAIILKAFLESENIKEKSDLVESLKKSEKQNDAQSLSQKEYDLTNSLNELSQKETSLREELSELIQRERNLPESPKVLKEKLVKRKKELFSELENVTKNKKSLNKELRNIKDSLAQKNNDTRSHISEYDSDKGEVVVENPNYSTPSGYNEVLNLNAKLKQIITSLVKGLNNTDTTDIKIELFDLDQRLYSFIDNMSEYYKDANGNVLISKDDFINFKNEYIEKHSNEVEEFLNDISKNIKQNDQQFVINPEFVKTILSKIETLKLGIQTFFIFKEKDNSGDMVRSNYNDLLNTISTKDFLSVYRDSYINKDNPAVREFLATLIYRIFDLPKGNCNDSIYFIEDHFKDYVTKKTSLEINQLPDDHNDIYLRTIMNSGLLRIALVDTTNFIQNKNSVDTISTNLNKYTKQLMTRKDARENVVTPLSKLYKGILDLINPVILCKTNIETIQSKDVQEIFNKNITSFDTKEAIDFLEKLKKFSEDQLSIIKGIEDVSKQDSFVDDSSVVNIVNTVVDLRNAFDNEFKRIYQSALINYKIELENKK